MNSSARHNPPLPYIILYAGPAQLLDGKGVANAWQAEIAREVQKVTEEGGRPPGLAVVLVGDRPDSNIYVSRKQEACIKVVPSLLE